MPIVSRTILIIHPKQKILWIDSGVIDVIIEILIVVQVDISLEIWFLIGHCLGVDIEFALFLAIDF